MTLQDAISVHIPQTNLLPPRYGGLLPPGSILAKEPAESFAHFTLYAFIKAHWTSPDASIKLKYSRLEPTKCRSIKGGLYMDGTS